MQTFAGRRDRARFVAPDHEYPSHLELRLTATDAGGLQSTTSVRLDPTTSNLTLSDNRVGGHARPDAQRHDARGAVHHHGDPRLPELDQRAIAPDPRLATATPFRNWSDGGARTHNVMVNSSRTIQARFDRTRITREAALSQPGAGLERGDPLRMPGPEVGLGHAR